MVDVAVIILTCNQKDATLRCLSSFGDLDRDAARILVWDNGSTDGTETAIKSQFPDVEVCRSDQNLGVAGGRNAGANAAIELWEPTFLFFLDNDTVVTPNAIQNLQRPFAEISDLGMTTPKILLFNDPERIDVAGGCRVQFHLGQTPTVGHGEIDRGQYDNKRDCVANGMTLVRSNAFEAVDGFDTAYNPYGFEDLDFCLRVKEAGYRCVYIPEAVIYHSPTQTFEGGKYSEQYARQKAKNWYRFVRRHANPIEEVAFWLLGVPIRLVGAFGREARQGNISALAGLITGGLNQIFRSSEQK